MPGIGGIQHVVGELRAQLGQTQADFLVTRLCGGGKTNAAALEVFQRVVNDFAARRGERFVSGAVAQGFDGSVEAFVLAEVAGIGGERGQECFVSGAPVVGAGYRVQMCDRRDGFGKAVFQALQRLYQAVPAVIATRDERFNGGAVFLENLRDDGGMFGADGGKGGNVGGLVKRVVVGHGVSCGLLQRVASITALCLRRVLRYLCQPLKITDDHHAPDR